MTNYLANFQSLIEISIALNIAFVALTTISDKIKSSFASSIKNKVENTMDEVGDFEDTTNIHFKEMDIEENVKKGFQEKIQNILMDIMRIEEEFVKKKETIFNQMLEFSKKFYVMIATYAIYTLFFSGHLSCGVASAYTSFSVFTISVVSFLIYFYYKKPNITLFQIPIFISIYFAFIMILTYTGNWMFGDTYPFCDTVNTFFYNQHKPIVYLSILILYVPVFLSLFILYNGKKSLGEDFNDKLNSVVEAKSEIAKTIEDISANTGIAEAAREEAEKLSNKLSSLVK